MSPEPRIHVGITQMLLAAASEVGLSRPEILAEAGLTEAGLTDAEGRIDLSAHRRVGEAILARCPGRDLPSLVADIASPAAFGVVGKIIQNGADLRAALTSLARYQQLVIEGLHLGMTSHDCGVELVARVPTFLDALHHPVLAVFAVFISLGRQLTGVTIAPQRVTFALRARPGDLRALTPLFGVAPTFGAERHAMHFDAATLALPILGARPDREAMFRTYANSLMAELHLETGIAADVCRVLVTCLPEGMSGQGHVARELGVSGRTLSRRLKEEGTTFGQLLEQVRRELSQHYLRDASLSVQEVSFLLGYSEPSTFFRAFRRWTGTTPRAWRAAI